MIFYEYKNIDLSQLIDISDIEIVKKSEFNRETKERKTISYYNIPCSFDIETSSWFENGEKRASMYIWQMDINGVCFYGREWGEFIDCLKKLQSIFSLSDTNRLIIYVHNLSYEFNFIRHHLNIVDCFALSNRKVVKFLCDYGVEFKCSYILSGKSLSVVADDLQNYKIKKLYGDLDYTQIRHSTTPLLQQELEYCYNDIKIIEYYIREKMNTDGNIAKIKLTSTSYVRSYVRSHCFGNDIKDKKKAGIQNRKYKKLMQGLKINGADEYKQLQRAFMGGFTHSNPCATNLVWQDVTSIDFTSSYPTQMIAHYFPMSSSEYIKLRSKDEFFYNLKKYCCIFDIKFINLRKKIDYDHYLSYSKCWNICNYKLSNGRVVSCDECLTTLTEIDYNIMTRCYEWDSVVVSNFRRYQRNYLPAEIIDCCLKFYVDKTQLKDVKGEEFHYLLSKGMLNSIYGMICTSLLGSDSVYKNNEWVDNIQNLDTVIDEYNNDKMRFLYYPWAIYTTCWARWSLWTGILEFKDDYIYSDTDSIKAINYDKHIDYVNKYNQYIINELKKSLNHYGIEIDSLHPKTIKGVEKPLGVWDYDGHYHFFKTCGAKRYMSYERGEIKLTVSGVNKKTALPYIFKKCNDDRIIPFDFFADGMYIPPGYSGKKCLTYIDYETNGIVTDYLGNTNTYHELTSIHMGNSDYRMGMLGEFMDYIEYLHIEYKYDDC